MSLAVWLIERPRWFKRTLLIVNDFAMLSIALWAAYSLRLSQLYVPEDFEIFLLMLAAPVVGVLVFYWRGLYKLVTRFIGPEGTTRIYTAVIIAAVLVGPRRADERHPGAAALGRGDLCPDRRRSHPSQPAVGGRACCSGRRPNTSP